MNQLPIYTPSLFVRTSPTEAVKLADLMALDVFGKLCGLPKGTVGLISYYYFKVDTKYVVIMASAALVNERKHLVQEDIFTRDPSAEFEFGYTKGFDYGQKSIAELRAMNALPFQVSGLPEDRGRCGCPMVRENGTLTMAEIQFNLQY